MAMMKYRICMFVFTSLLRSYWESCLWYFRRPQNKIKAVPICFKCNLNRKCKQNAHVSEWWSDLSLSVTPSTSEQQKMSWWCRCRSGCHAVPTSSAYSQWRIAPALWMISSWCIWDSLTVWVVRWTSGHEERGKRPSWSTSAPRIHSDEWPPDSQSGLGLEEKCVSQTSQHFCILVSDWSKMNPNILIVIHYRFYSNR